MLFDSWTGLGRVILAGVFAYLALVLWLRVSGKRMLSKWNAFDFAITVALGSTLANVLLSKDVALAEGVLALALLIALQFAITWLSVRSSILRRLIKGEPKLLLKNGQFIHAAMKSERVTESEIRAAVRSAGIAAIEEVEAVVLETNGTFSIIKHSPGSTGSALAGVANTEAEAV